MKQAGSLSGTQNSSHPLSRVTTNTSNASKSDEMNLSFELACATRQQLVLVDEGAVDRRMEEF